MTIHYPAPITRDAFSGNKVEPHAQIYLQPWVMAIFVSNCAYVALSQSEAYSLAARCRSASAYAEKRQDTALVKAV